MTRPRIENTPIPQPIEGEDNFTSISRMLASSAAFGTLTPVEMRIYLAIAIRHNGFNNGQIVLGVAKAVEETGICRQKVMPALRRLEDLGLIVRRYMGKLLKDKEGRISGASEKRASEWEITDFHTWDKPIGSKDRKMISASRNYADWSPEKQEIVPGHWSKNLPKPRAGASASKPKSATRVPSKPKSPIRRPASVSATKPAPSAPSRSQRSEPAIPETASPELQRRPGQRTYDLDEILRDDASWLARHGTPRPPTQSRPDGKWYHLGKLITEAQADALIVEEVPF